MQVILSHTNLDFDGLASMVAAKKLHPDALLVLPGKCQSAVAHYLAIHKDLFSITDERHVNWESVTEAILTDTSSLQRTGKAARLAEDIPVLAYDHHGDPPPETASFTCIHKKYGACITVLLEMIDNESIEVSPFEATLFALGLYSDTGSLSYSSTCPEDLLAGSRLLKAGASLEVVEQFREAPLSGEEQMLFRALMDGLEIEYFDGVDVAVAVHEQDSYTGGLASIAGILLSVTGADAIFCLVRMSDKTFVTARSASDRINVLPVVKTLGGGGHAKAASAMRKDLSPFVLADELRHQLQSITGSNITAKDIMSSPVRVVAPDTSVEDVSKMLYRYGHTGFPVTEQGRLAGIISRRDVDKALHHNLGHAPVKGYMSTSPVTITPDTSLEEIQAIMTEKNVGRMPVIDHGEVLGIVSRSNVIEALQGKSPKPKAGIAASEGTPSTNLAFAAKSRLSEELYTLITLIGNRASNLNMKPYLIGGIVRDLILGRENEDIDIVVEGNAIELGENLAAEEGGSVRTHEAFQTATWTSPHGIKIDLTSARTEYYDYPAALPQVELSSIKEDLYRRDFTINALGMSLSPEDFGQLIDFFNGYMDIRSGKIKVLYNLSFTEDPTRILRALRFEHRFSFKMDEQTENLAKNHGRTLTSVSKSRLAGELSRLLAEESPVYFVKRAADLGVLPYILSSHEDVITCLSRLTVYEEIVKQINAADTPLHDWTAILVLLSSFTEEAFLECLSYGQNKQETQLVSDIRSICDAAAGDFPRLSDWHRLLAGKSTIASAVYFAKAGSEDKKTAESGRTYLVERERVKGQITGQDLIDLGLEPGPSFKDWLLEMEAKWLDEPSLTKKEVMSWAEKTLFVQ
ncbi:CBS domain-containing protein [Alteribacter natronophilus]|uniref:CBS domain-containing protein n=1 Tax=Alteribacter natronophilus TaxID=2583810 RepID=UPI00110E4272|nr:CBS domain-containing protein [Alteribacter natronophilus]TMW73900.1 CBS domain-containing protein [Alteribacter natronophilus]